MLQALREENQVKLVNMINVVFLLIVHDASTHSSDVPDFIILSLLEWDTSLHKITKDQRLGFEEVRVGPIHSESVLN